MARITIEVYPWLTDFFLPRRPGKLAWEEEIAAGSTLRGLLRQLHLHYHTFVQNVYDPRADLVRSHVNINVNDRMLNMVTALDEPLHDGDRVTFVPGFSGG